MFIVPAGVHVSVAGSKISALSVAVLAVLSRLDPPSARILPVGRMTASI